MAYIPTRIQDKKSLCLLHKCHFYPTLTVFPIWSNRPCAYITLDSLVMAPRVARLETRQTPSASASVAAAARHAPESETEELISPAHISGTTQGYRVFRSKFDNIWP